MIWRSSFNGRIAQLADFLTVLCSFFIAYQLWTQAYLKLAWPFISPPIALNKDIVLTIVTYPIIFIWFLKANGAYSFQRFTSLLKEFKNLFKTSIIWILLGSFLIYMLTHLSIPRIYILIEFSTVLLMLMAQKTVMYLMAQWLRKKGYNRKKILLAGSGSRAQKFIETVNKKFNWGLDIIGIITDTDNFKEATFFSYPVLGNYSDIESILKKFNPEEIVITTSTRYFDELMYMIETCEREGVQVRLKSDFLGQKTGNIRLDWIYDMKIISLYRQEPSEISLFIKRLIDIFGSVIAIVLFSPVMIIAGFGILLTDGRPIFYNWKVVGLNKVSFQSWKFRTMVRDADKLKEQLKRENQMMGPVFKIEGDPRVIPFGRWLRKWSIDETPQLLSVLKGDMSLVGPRPAGPHELDQYESWHRRKLSIKPGITCLWQVGGRNAIQNFDDWVKLDLEYIDNWSLTLDLKILAKTIFTVLRGTGK